MTFDTLSDDPVGWKRRSFCLQVQVFNSKAVASCLNERPRENLEVVRFVLYDVAVLFAGRRAPNCAESRWFIHYRRTNVRHATP